MRVAVLHNAVPEDAPLEDQDTLVQVGVVKEALIRLGHEPATVSCTLDLEALADQLQRLRPEVIFNLVESLGGADSLAYLPLAVLDVLGLPYTGSRTESFFLTTHKLLAKQRLLQAGLPTPAWMESEGAIHEGHEVHEGDKAGFSEEWGRKVDDKSKNKNPSSLSVPKSSCLSDSSCPSWIIKGVWDQGSRDMEDDAVFANVDRTELQERLVERAARSGRSCFAEQFVEGREFNLSMLAGPAGPEVLPPAEIDFSAFPPGKPRIVGYRAKWRTDSFEYRHTPWRFQFDASDGPLLERLRGLAKACWSLFELRGWGRVDFRVDLAGQPWILEVNANSCLSPDAGFVAAIKQASIPFDAAVQRILDDVRRSP